MVVTLHYFRCLPSDWRFIAVALQKDESVVFTSQLTAQRRENGVIQPNLRSGHFPLTAKVLVQMEKLLRSLIKHRKFELKMT